MRDIKFRVWRTDDKKMYGPDQPFVMYTDGLIPSVESGVPMPKYPIGEAILLQFTGLKDMHGIDIYEGDLVKFTGKTKRDKIRTYQVLWENTRSRFIGKHIAYAEQYMSIRMFAENHEVIGNIYETPEVVNGR